MLEAIRDGAVGAQIGVIRAVQTDTADSQAIQTALFAQMAHVRFITKNPKQREELDNARAAYLANPHATETREELISWLKRGLPAIAFSGTFTHRSAKGLQTHSGLICVDLDDLPDPAATVAQIGAAPHCVAAFLSPTGTGAKLVLRVAATDAQQHRKRVFPAVAAYLLATHGVTADKACSDVVRLCFVSHDPSITINLGAAPLPIPDAPVANAPGAMVAAAVGAKLTPFQDYDQRGDVFDVLRDHGWSSDDDFHWTRPGKSSGTSATFDHADCPGCFYVFSDNAAPFEPQKAYPKHRVFALLECDGDEATALSELQKRGFGWPLSPDGNFLILPSNGTQGRSITESAQQIFTKIAPTHTLFVRGRVVHEIVEDENGPRFEVILPRRFRSLIETYGRPMAYRSDNRGRTKLSPVLCAEETASALLATTEARELLPRVRTIIRSPTLAVSGDELKVLGHGWNQEGGGVFVTGSLIPESVALPDAVAAVCGLLADFDFQTPGDRARALASLITPALKAGGLLNCSTPIETNEADKSQAGKTFLRKLVHALFGETPSFVAQRDGGVGSFDESIQTALIAGRMFIQLDNVRGKVASTYLEAVLTAEGPVQCREPHKTTVEVDVRPFTFAMTSNGVQSTADLANRASLVRIRKRPPGYIFAQYPEGGLLEHVKARQAFFLGAVFAIVGEWFMEGCQRTNETRHDFRQWAQTLDWIVRHVLNAGPLLDGHDDARDRIADPCKSWLRSVALAIDQDDRLEHEVTASELGELCGEHGIMVPSCKDDATDDDRARAVGRAMKKLFPESATLAQVDSFTVTRGFKYSATAEKNIPTYRISKHV